jgi:hypothetical protein
MTCIHLRELYQLCQNEKLKLSSSDLIHIVCEKCGEQEVCPSLLTQEDPEDQESEEETSPDETDQNH